MSKLFTLEQANALIPSLESLMTKARDAKALLDRYRGQIEGVGTQARGDGHTQYVEIHELERSAETAASDLQRIIEEVQSIGCEVKDLDRGLVDFPSDREGRVVYLCWRLGEDEIRYWHDTDTGFSGRQPI